MRLAAAALDDVAQQSLRTGVTKVRMRIQQQVGAALAGLANFIQCGAQVGRDLAFVLAVEVHSPQALGNRPAVQRPPGMHQGLPEQFDHPRFVGCLDDQQRRVGADQRHEVLQFAHVAHDSERIAMPQRNALRECNNRRHGRA